LKEFGYLGFHVIDELTINESGKPHESNCVARRLLTQHEVAGANESAKDARNCRRDVQ
jgi:hypothetical protein